MKKVKFFDYKYIILLFLIPLIYFPCYTTNEILMELTKEDGLYEYTGALFFLLTAILFFILSAKSNLNQSANKNGRKIHRLYYLLLALLFVFAFGEEISWGQRIFNYSTPEAVKEINRQDEFNLHNIGIFHGKTSEGVSKTGILKMFTMTRIFYLSFLIYLLIIPFTYRISTRFRSFINKIRLPLPPISIGVLFSINILFARMVEEINYDLNLQGITEIKETVFALLLMLVPLSWMFMKSLKKPSLVIGGNV